MKRGILLAIACFIASFAATVPTAAQAYTWQNFYTGNGGKWPNYSNVYYLVRQGFPSSTYYNRVEDGATQWNNIGGSSGIEPDLLYNGSTTNAGDPNAPCSATYSGVYWRNLDFISTATLGYTPHCENSSGVVTRFSMSIDNRSTWYVGNGTPGSSQDDLWSTTSHEMGHATGWMGHYNAGDSLCADNQYQATMCPIYFTGTVRWRTLDSTTVGLFQAAY